MVWVEDSVAGLVLALIVLAGFWVWLMIGVSKQIEQYESEP
jgi:cytoskeletal protein RodZ